MDTPSFDDVLAEMRRHVRNAVSAGLTPRAEMVEGIVELFSDDADEDEIRPHVEQMADEELAAHREAQKSWPLVTDCDRLDGAFRDLEASGIVCRQDFTCCGTCGSAEIWAEMENQVPPARGYAFYHQQDTESAVEGDGLFLNYGAVAEGEAAALEIAQEIAIALTHYGLKVEWNGSWEERIGVTLDWKRRTA